METTDEFGALDAMVLTMIALMVVIIVFLALWAPAAGSGLRGSLLSLIQDPNFTATYGADVGVALVYLLDLVPLIAVFVGLATLYTLVKGVLKNPGKSIGL